MRYRRIQAPILVLALIGILALPGHTAEPVTSRDELSRELITASAQCHIDSMTRLLNSGADPNFYDNHYTPLVATLRTGGVPEATWFEAIEILLKHGADPNTLCQGYSSLWVADGIGWPNNPVDVPPHTLRSRVLPCVQLLITHGADVNIRSKGPSPLTDALQVEDAELARLYIQHGANINQVDLSGRTALEVAAARIPAMVPTLLQLGADPNRAPSGNRTALMAAVENRDRKTVQLLLKHGATVDAVGPDGVTALMVIGDVSPVIAMKKINIYGNANRDVSLCKILLAAGANILAKDTRGMTAFDHASGNGREQLANYLSEHMPNHPHHAPYIVVP